MRYFRMHLLLLFCILIFTRISEASCGSSNCSFEPHATQTQKKWSLGLAYEEINLNHPFIGDQGASIGAISQHHDEIQTINKLWTISLSGPLTPQWGLSIDLPLVSRQHQHVHNHHGHAIFSAWDYTGWGDLSVGAHYMILDPSSPQKIAFSAILKLPTGVTSLKNASGEEAEISIQPGSGSYDTTWGISYDNGQDLPLFVSTFYTFFGNGSLGWRFGNKWALNIGSRYTFSHQYSGELQINTVAQNKSDAGSTGEPTSTTGGTIVYLTPILKAALWNGLDAYVLGQFPLYRNVNSIQITSDINFKTGLTTSF